MKRKFSLISSGIDKYEEFPPIRGNCVDCRVSKTNEYACSINFFVQDVIIPKKSQVNKGKAKKKKKSKAKKPKLAEEEAIFLDEAEEDEEEEEEEDEVLSLDTEDSNDGDDNNNAKKTQHEDNVDIKTSLKKSIITLGGILCAEMTSPFIDFTVNIHKCQHQINDSSSTGTKTLHDFDVKSITEVRLKCKEGKNERQEIVYTFNYEDIVVILKNCQFLNLVKKKEVAAYFEKTFSLGKGNPLVLPKGWLLSNSTLQSDSIKHSNYLFKNVWRSDIGIYEFITHLGFSVRQTLTEDELDDLFITLSQRDVSKYLNQRVKTILLNHTLIDPLVGQRILEYVQSRLNKNSESETESASTVRRATDYFNLLQKFMDLYKKFFIEEKYNKNSVFYLSPEIANANTEVIEFINEEPCLAKELRCIKTYKPCITKIGVKEEVFALQRIDIGKLEEDVARFFIENESQIYLIEESGFPFVSRTTINNLVECIRDRILPVIGMEKMQKSNTIIMTAQKNRLSLLEAIFKPIVSVFIADLPSIDREVILTKKLFIFDCFMVMGIIDFAKFIKQFLCEQRFTCTKRTLVFTGCKYAFPAELGKPFQDVLNIWQYKKQERTFMLGDDVFSEINSTMLLSNNPEYFNDTIPGINMTNHVYDNIQHFFETVLKPRVKRTNSSNRLIMQNGNLNIAICTPDYKIKEYSEKLQSILSKAQTDQITENRIASEDAPLFCQELEKISLLLIKHCRYNSVVSKVQYTLFPEYKIPKLTDVNSLNAIIIIPKDQNCLTMSKIGHLIAYNTEIFFLKSLDGTRHESVVVDMLHQFKVLPSKEQSFPQSNLSNELNEQI